MEKFQGTCKIEKRDVEIKGKKLKFKTYTAKAIDEVKSEIKLTYVLYRVLGNGTLSKYGQNENFDRICNNKWLKDMEKDDVYIIKKKVTQTNEEPVFKITK